MSGLIKAEPGKGASLHIHETNEVFIPLTGKWGIYWQNSDGQRHEVVLEPYDTVSVPIGASRGFRNAGDGTALMLAVVGGTDPGKVHWPEETIEGGAEPRHRPRRERRPRAARRRLSGCRQCLLRRDAMPPRRLTVRDHAVMSPVRDNKTAERTQMAKANSILIKLVSSAGTGFYYTTRKNPRSQTEKLSLRKFDPVARKHVVFKEAKIK